MATRSTIGVKTPDGIISIYCHSDGYPDHNGRILKEHYTSQTKVMELMQLGDLSVLGENLGGKTDFDRGAPPGGCLAYGRDRKEEDTEAIVHDTLHEWKAARRNWGCEYGYLFDMGTGKWKTYNL